MANVEAGKVILARGQVALVDERDLGLVSGRRWWAAYRGTSEVLYARGWIDGRCVLMHRFILSPGPGQCVDHINGDGLDNRRDNLRLADTLGNSRNTRKRKAGKSAYKGVTKSKNRWTARIQVDGSSVFLGSFLTEAEAALAYNEAAAGAFGEFACLNSL